MSYWQELICKKRALNRAMFRSSFKLVEVGKNGCTKRKIDLVSILYGSNYRIQGHVGPAHAN